MKVKFEAANQNQTIFYYSDVVVTCSSEVRDNYFVNYPCVIFEVLSPSTEVSDRQGLVDFIGYVYVSSISDNWLKSDRNQFLPYSCTKKICPTAFIFCFITRNK